LNRYHRGCFWGSRPGSAAAQLKVENPLLLRTIENLGFWSSAASVIWLQRKAYSPANLTKNRSFGDTVPMPTRTLHAKRAPQNETIWTIYDTPADLVRLILGIGVCAWLLYQLFQVPKDASSSRTWFYLGLVAVPFTMITLFAVW
jgi:hypothetical protein